MNNRRLQKIPRGVQSQWPDLLVLVATSLDSGLGLADALQLAKQQAPEPLRSFLNERLKGMPAWAPLEDQINRLFHGTDLTTPRAALLLASQAGGKISPLLKMNSRLLKKKEEMEQKTKMLTAQVRLSAWIVGLSPFAFFVMIAVMLPETASLLVHTKMGLLLVGLVLLLVVTGLIVVHRLSQIDS